MDKEQAIERGLELSYEEDADMIVGEVKGLGFVVAHNEDYGTIYSMNPCSMMKIHNGCVEEI